MVSSDKMSSTKSLEGCPEAKVVFLSVRFYVVQDISSSIGERASALRIGSLDLVCLLILTPT